MRKDILAKELKAAKAIKFPEPKPPKKSERWVEPPSLRVPGDKVAAVKEWKIGQDVTFLVRGKVKSLNNWDGEPSARIDVTELSYLK